MKIFVLNGFKLAHTAFGIFCLCIIIYVGFAPQIDTVIASAEVKQPTYIALIIKDFGSGMDGTKEFLYMDIPYTALVNASGYNVNEDIKRLAEGDRDIFLNIDSQLPKALALDFNSIQGLNIYANHKLLQDDEVIFNIVSFAKNNNLMILDTSHKGINTLETISYELDVPFFQKDIILDETKNNYKIEKNLKKAANIAHKNGYAIAVAHLGNKGGRATAQAIKNINAEFEEKNIQFVTLTQLVEIRGH